MQANHDTQEHARVAETDRGGSLTEHSVYFGILDNSEGVEDLPAGTTVVAADPEATQGVLTLVYWGESGTEQGVLRTAERMGLERNSGMHVLNKGAHALTWTVESPIEMTGSPNDDNLPPSHQNTEDGNFSRSGQFYRAEEEERFVLGVAAEPDQETGADGAPLELIDAGEIRRAAHGWMEKFQQFSANHMELAPGVRVLESFIAPADFNLEGETIKRGSWVLGVRIIDENIWANIKAGNITGFSIGGVAQEVVDVA